MIIFDNNGWPVLTIAEKDVIAAADMFTPVRCTHCGGIYDLGTIEVTERYTDCSMWQSPCCSRLVDDRGETGWKSRNDYVRINL